MKFERNPKYTAIAIYVFLVIAAIIVFYEVVKNASGLFVLAGDVIAILQPVVIGFVLAYLLNPILRFIEDRLLLQLFKKRMRPKVRRGVALLVTYLIALIMFTMFIAIIVPQLVISIKSIFNQVPQLIQMISTLYSKLLEQLAGLQILEGGSPTNALTNSMVDKLIGITQGLLETVYGSIERLLPTVLLATTKITTGVVNAILGIIISIYFLFDREKLFAQIKKIVAALFPKRVGGLLTEIALESHRIFSGFITGKLIDSLIIGILCFILMWILKLNYAVLISFIVGVTNVIPYFGPFFGAIPSALILYMYSPRQAFWFLIMLLVLQQFDGNILGPKILGGTTGLSAFWVIFAITFFNGILGPLGMFIGVPLFALIYSLSRKFIAYLLKRKGESVNTRDYDSARNPLLK